MKDDPGRPDQDDASLAESPSPADAPFGGQEIPANAPKVPVVKAPGDPPKRKKREEPGSEP